MFLCLTSERGLQLISIVLVCYLTVLPSDLAGLYWTLWALPDKAIQAWPTCSTSQLVRRLPVFCFSSCRRDELWRECQGFSNTRGDISSLRPAPACHGSSLHVLSLQPLFILCDVENSIHQSPGRADHGPFKGWVWCSSDVSSIHSSI